MTTMPVPSTQHKPPLSERQKSLAQHVFHVTSETLRALNLQSDVIHRLCLVGTGQMEILFVVLDTRRIVGRLEPYAKARHQISTNLKGMPVAISNTTGFRFAILLSKPPDLPRMVELPDLKPGRLQIGVGIGGKLIALA